jgi:hypothetical protein
MIINRGPRPIRIQRGRGCKGGIIQRGSGVFSVYKGLRIHRGHGYAVQRGRGIGAIFKGLIRLIAPIIKKSIQTVSSTGRKAIKSDLGRQIIKEGQNRLIKTGKNILADVIETGDIKQSVKKELKQQKKQLERDIELLRKKSSDYVRGKRKSNVKPKSVKRRKIKKILNNSGNTSLYYKKSKDIFSQ